MACGFGNPRHSRLGSLRYFGCSFAALQKARFMESSVFLSDLLTTHEPEFRKPLEINKTILRFMGSPLFLTDLLTGHEPDRVGAVRRWKQCGRCRPMVPCARWRDWFRWWITAHFGEARVGFPVGKICLLQNSTGLSVLRLTEAML